MDRAVAGLLLALALLPTGPILGLGLPVELGFVSEERGAPRVSSAVLAARSLARALETLSDLDRGGTQRPDEPPATPLPPVDPSDPFGIRERPAPPRGEIPPPPAPPDFSLARAPAGAAAAVAPGAEPSQVSVPVLPAWNLLSISWTPGDPSPAAVLAPIAGAYTRAYTFDACDSADPWKLWEPANPGASDFAAITPAHGFWLEGAAAATLPEAGPEPVETAIPLCVGWNLIGFPASAPQPVEAALASIAGRYLRVFSFDPTDPADSWEVFDVGVPAWANDLVELVPGRGYWIYVTEASTLTVSNAGDGPTVAIAAPVDLAEVTEPTAVVGTVRSPSLAGWQLAYRAEGDPSWIELASGTTPVEAAPLGTFDPTLLENGLHELRLFAVDTVGRTAERVIDLLLDGQMKIGHFSLTFVDLEVPLAGLPIQVLRTYDSRRRDRQGDFGFGWTMEVRQGSLVHNRPVGESWQIAAGLVPCQQALELAPHLTTVRLSDREIYRFRPVLSALSVTAGGCFATAGYQFVDGPVPGAVLEVLGNRNVFWASGDDRLIDVESFTVFDPTTVRLSTRYGRLFELERGVGVTRLADANGNAITFAAGAITHSSGASITLERDALGRVLRVTDPAGAEVLYGYDGDGDLVGVTDRAGATTQFGYLPGHFLETIVDPLGRTPIRNEYGPDGRLLRHVDAFGHEILYDHQLAERREIVTNRLGASRLLEYDARGNVTREVDETGIATLRSFDGEDQLLSEAVGALPPTLYAYDADRNLTQLTDPLGHLTSFTYDARGNVLTSTDPRGGVTTNAYDARGNLLQTTDPLGALTRYTYDARGNLLSEIDPHGATTAYLYDGRGNLTRETDPLGSVAIYTYDSQGNRRTESRTRTRGDGTQEILVTTFTYDASGRMVQTTAPDGSLTATEYNPLGLVTATVDPLGRRTEIAYDELGRRVRIDFPDGTWEESGYDAEGRRVSARDRAGRTTSFEYDAAGRLRKTTYPDGAMVEQLYDAAGRLERTIDPRGLATLYGYDAAGRRRTVTDALGQATTFAYDAAGNQSAITDPRGFTTSFVYDASSRLTRTVFPDGTFRRSEYDALGRRTAEIDEAAVRTEFTYDALGRLTAVTDALGQVTSYGYDELGNRTAQTDANGHLTRFHYDALGRQTKRILPDGAEERFTYDAVGNRRTRVDFAGRTTQYLYDASNRLLRRTYPDGSFHAFTYTATGRRATMVDGRGTTSYAHDSRDRVTGLTYPDGRSLGFAYDLAGNRTGLTAFVGGQALATSFTYDALSRLDTVTDPAGGVYVHGYDENGNRASLAHPNGVATSYQHDNRNRLRELTAVHAVSGTVVSYLYTLAATGQRTRITEQDGTTRHYGYDPLSRLTDEHVLTGPAPDAPTAWRNGFIYDPVGNRLHQERTQGAGAPLGVTYAYDSRDRLLTENEVAYGWDANGNQTSKTGPDGATYEWDPENRLTRVTLATGTTVEHTYDADGTRMRTRTTPATGPPTTIDYLVDPWHQTSAAGRTLILSQVVAESDPTAGTLLAHHVRGDDLLATLRPDPATPNTWVPRYFHAEGIGTIRALTNEAGEVTDRYTLEAFGTLFNHQGDDPNAYLFAGEPLDPNSGFYYNRARWLDPNAGRFASEDGFQGFEEDPLSLHKYLYVTASPADSTDPTGFSEFSLNALAISMTVGGIVNSIASYNVGNTFGDIVGDFVKGAVIGGIEFYTAGPFVRIAWKAAKYFKGAIQLFRFRGVAMVGFKSPVAPYNVLQAVTKGHKGAIQAHHILEARHMRAWGYTVREIAEAPAQVLARAEHTRLSTLLAKELPTGIRYSRDQVWAKYQIIYAEYPAYLRSIQRYFIP